jgi:small neutral amino acid transporter SnatA (MarC family)
VALPETYGPASIALRVIGAHEAPPHDNAIVINVYNVLIMLIVFWLKASSTIPLRVSYPLYTGLYKFL